MRLNARDRIEDVPSPQSVCEHCSNCFGQHSREYGKSLIWTECTECLLKKHFESDWSVFTSALSSIVNQENILDVLSRIRGFVERGGKDFHSGENIKRARS